MNWTIDYLGIPYAQVGRTREGCDCWGLARLVYRNLLQVDLPSYAASVCASGAADVAALIGETAAAHPWLEVTEPLPFDLLLFRRGSYAQHLGICVDRHWMLHMDRTGSKLARLADSYWVSRSLGAWRHAEVRNG